LGEAHHHRFGRDAPGLEHGALFEVVATASGATVAALLDAPVTFDTTLVNANTFTGLMFVKFTAAGAVLGSTVHNLITPMPPRLMIRGNTAGQFVFVMSNGGWFGTQTLTCGKSIVMYDAAGQVVYARCLGGPSVEELVDGLAIDPQGDVFISFRALGAYDVGDGPHILDGPYGSVLVKIDTTGHTQWTRPFVYA
jgi:hypothetical protein